LERRKDSTAITGHTEEGPRERKALQKGEGTTQVKIKGTAGLNRVCQHNEGRSRGDTKSSFASRTTTINVLSRKREVMGIHRGGGGETSLKSLCPGKAETVHSPKRRKKGTTFIHKEKRKNTSFFKREALGRTRACDRGESPK